VRSVLLLVTTFHCVIRQRSGERPYQADVLVVLGGQARPAEVEGRADSKRAQVAAANLVHRNRDESFICNVSTLFR